MAWDKNLQLFVSGKCLSGGSYKWITRRSSDLGVTWVTEDVFQVTPGQTTYANGVDADDRGLAFAVGFGDDGKRNHWIVRKRECSPGGGPGVRPNAR